MTVFRNLLICIFLLCAFPFHLNAVPLKNQAIKSFWHPTFQGDRLNYCSLDGKKCGKAIANHYCKMLGYEYASQNVIAYNLGLTHYLSARARCVGWTCHGFMTIDCATNLSHSPPKSYHYREKQFAYPRINEYRVDWCYAKNKGCGRRAANAFCVHRGFLSAKNYVQERHFSATQAIGNQKLCFGNQCNAFKSIRCTR